MSWSISYVGKPELIAKALEEESAKMSGQSKVEFDDAKPHLIGLVTQNFVSDKGPQAGNTPIVRVRASGHGSAEADGNGGSHQLYRNCDVSIERLGSGLLV